MSDPISIAPHLQRALTAMSKDMALEPQAIVNQAVFAWLRINGYVLPGVAGATEAVVAAPAPVAPAPAPAAPPPPAPVAAVEPAPVPVPRTPTPVPAPPPPAPEAPPPAVIVSPSVPAVDLAPALARMAQIDADLEKLTKPWPAWAPAPKEEEEEDEEQEEAPPPAAEQPEEQEEEQEQEEAEEPAPAPVEEEEEISEKIPAAAAPPEEEPAPEPNTGETELEGAGESTIVLRSAPIALYLERDGIEPIKVDTDRFIIGRGPHCDLVIDSPRVSREHVAITRKGVVYYLEDLKSSNGTWFGEERVTRRELESGDVISLGNEPVTFFIRAE